MMLAMAPNLATAVEVGLAPSAMVQAVASAVMIAFAAAFVLALIRLLLGPSLADRVVALDLIAVLAAGMISVHSVQIEQPMLLRAAIVLALVAFLGTVAFALYLEKRAEP